MSAMGDAALLVEVREGDAVPKDAAGAVADGLLAHRRAAVPGSAVPLAVFLRDPVTACVAGGLVAEVALGWLYVKRFWLPDALRGRGHGAAVLAAAEAAARDRHGAVGAHLNTSTWQAPGFYLRQGYEEIGRLRDRPPGHDRIWMAKRWG